MLEAKVAVVRLLQRFVIEVCAGQSIFADASSKHPKHGIFADLRVATAADHQRFRSVAAAYVARERNGDAGVHDLVQTTKTMSEAMQFNRVVKPAGLI
jgi:hypothetical protein